MNNAGQGFDAISQEQTPVSFQEEAGGFALANERLVLRFSKTAKGTLIGLRRAEGAEDLVSESEAETDGWLWRLQVRSGEEAPVILTNREAEGFTQAFTTRPDGTGQVELGWVGAGLRVTATVTLSPGTAVSLWQLSVEAEAGKRVAEVVFPAVAAVGPNSRQEEALVLPEGMGVRVRHPRQAMFGRALSNRNLVENYPGTVAMQFVGFEAGQLGALYFAAHDPAAKRKELRMEGMPHSDRIRFSLTQELVAPFPGKPRAMTYAAAIGVMAGDYYELARTYAGWANKQAWCAQGTLRDRQGKRPMATPGALWLKQEGKAQGVIAAARSLQRLTNHQVRLRWQDWWGCDGGEKQADPLAGKTEAAEQVRPDYFPPRDGDEVFHNAMEFLHQAGILVELDLDAVKADARSRAWEEEKLAEVALPREEGGPEAEMCLASARWRERLARLIWQAAGAGADGICLQSLAAGAGQTCEIGTHNHDSEGIYKRAQRLGKDLRPALRADFHLSSDSCLEAGLASIDAFYATRPEVSGSELEAQKEPIPLLQTVYHAYVPVLGPATPFGGRPAQMAKQQGETRTADELHVDQFCYELARSFVWGNQLLLEDFDEAHAMEGGNGHKVAFLAAALRAQNWAAADFFWLGELLSMLAIGCEPLTVEFQVMQAGRRRVFQQALPRVVGSAWRGYQGAVRLAIINYSGQDADFTTRLHLARLGLKVPLLPNGRTFSEVGDRAARLGCLGSDLMGKLPARSITLVSL